jgi:beta-phosphoglucomutase-like phosphatase (HAD superfamily)
MGRRLPGSSPAREQSSTTSSRRPTWSSLDKHFRFIVAAGETARGKPAPDPYRRAARLHARPPEQCVAIEDSRWGIESAKDAGLHCVGITTSYPARDLSGADAIIGSLDEFTVDLLTRL